MSFISSVKLYTSKIADYLKARDAGPKPNLDPDAIMSEIEKDPVFNNEKFRDGKICLRSFDSMFPQERQVETVQKALIALGIFKVDTTRRYWWIKPSGTSRDTDGGVAWGTYGPRTIAAVRKLQDAAGIKDGMEGRLFGRDSLRMLQTALKSLKSAPFNII
jgi:hypothetical protein